MTTTENEINEINENQDSTIENGTTESTQEAAEPTEKNATYFDLVKATWLLARDLSSWGERDVFCVNGINEYLRAFDLPELIELNGNDEIVENYLRAWYNWKTWSVVGELSDQDDYVLRTALARRIRVKLQRDEPKSRETMNEWLAELGLDAFAPPPPPRHTGRYDVSYTESNQVTSARIQEALRQTLENLDVRVTYVGRIA